MNKKIIIFAVFGIVILAELIWAGWTLSKPNGPAALTSVTKPKSTSVSQPTNVSLTADKTSLRAGEKMKVSINISSEKLTDGTDLIILYDPKVLSVDSQNPVTLGKLYDDYPLNKVDTSLGKITVSGISNKKGGTLANGLFGSIIFTAKAAGKTKVSLDFAPGSTVDSNVIETVSGRDVLEKVNNLEITVI